MNDAPTQKGSTRLQRGRVIQAKPESVWSILVNPDVVLDPQGFGLDKVSESGQPGTVGWTCVSEFESGFRTCAVATTITDAIAYERLATVTRSGGRTSSEIWTLQPVGDTTVLNLHVDFTDYGVNSYRSRFAMKYVVSAVLDEVARLASDPTASPRQVGGLAAAMPLAIPCIVLLVAAIALEWWFDAALAMLALACAGVFASRAGRASWKVNIAHVIAVTVAAVAVGRVAFRVI